MSIAAGSASHTINVTLKAFLKGSIDKEKVFEATTIINVIQCQYTGALTSLFLDSTSPLDVIYNSSSDESKLLILNRVTSSESICSTTIELTSATQKLVRSGFFSARKYQGHQLRSQVTIKSTLRYWIRTLALWDPLLATVSPCSTRSKWNLAIRVSASILRDLSSKITQLIVSVAL